MSIIQISSKDKPRFIKECTKHISDILNTKIDFMDVSGELMLYEMGMNPGNEILSKFMISFLEDTTINK